jgi:hypothetical protein
MRMVYVRLRSVAAAAILGGGLVVTGVVPASPASAASTGSVVTVSFTDVGEHVFTPPPGVVSIHVVAIGGKGGGGYAPGGLGARVEGNVSAVPGSPLYVEVGSDGAAASQVVNTLAAGGANGGGHGGRYDTRQYAAAIGAIPLSGAGGGGPSDIQRCSISNCPRYASPLPNLLLVAAGGGGAGADSVGGAGGTPNGQNAATTRDQIGIGLGATTSHSGGNTLFGINPSPAEVVEGYSGRSYGGGGGGGGYYGGGGGLFGSAPPYELASGGGGGSSYGPAGTVYANTTDRPSVTISYSPSFTVRLAPAPNLSLLVDIAGSSTAWSATPIQATPTGSASQVWTFIPLGGYYQIMNKNSGLCLATDGLAGHALFQWPCMAVDPELWALPADFGADTNSWIRTPNAGLYMEVLGGLTTPGGVIDASPWNGGYNNQFFHPTPA